MASVKVVKQDDVRETVEILKSWIEMLEHLDSTLYAGGSRRLDGMPSGSINGEWMIPIGSNSIFIFHANVNIDPSEYFYSALACSPAESTLCGIKNA